MLDLELRRRCNRAMCAYVARWGRVPMPIVTCTYRDNEEQGQLWEQGRLKPGPIVTWAQPGDSPHNQVPSAAFDIAFIRDGVTEWDPVHFSRFAEIAEWYGIEWGGRWPTPDRPHFQIPGWKPGGTAHAWPAMPEERT